MQVGLILFMFHLRSRSVRAVTRLILSTRRTTVRHGRHAMLCIRATATVTLTIGINLMNLCFFFFQLRSLSPPKGHPLIFPLCRHFTLLCCVWVFHCLLLECWLVLRGCTPNCGCLKVFQDDLDDSLPRGVNPSARKCP